MSEAKLDISKVNEKSAAVRWLKDHTVHIMVLTNGIILTLATFWTLHLFVGQMLREDYLQAGANAKQSSITRMTDFQNAILDIGGYFETSQVSKEGMVSDPQVSQASIRTLDSLLWIPASYPESAIDLKSMSATSIKLQKADQDVVSKIMAATKSHAENFLYISPVSTSKMVNKETVIQARPIAIVVPIRSHGSTVGYLAGFSSLDKILEAEPAISQKFVSKTIFWDSASKVVLFFTQEVGDDGAASQLGNFEYNFSVNIGGSALGGQVVFKKSSKNTLLEILPFLIAGFGVIVTVIAWLYVANNYHKSKSLSNINEVLAVKNTELNNQIREREKLFQTLRKSERENHAIINGISDIIFEVSPTGEILFLNEAWVKITGFDLATSLGRNLFDLINPTDQEEQKKNIISLAKGHKTAYRTLTKLRSIEGTFRSVELVVSMLRQDENRNLRVVGSFTDIEERERAAAALSEAEKKYKTIWENAAGGIYQLTPEGQFLSANPALARIFGYDTEDHLLKLVRNAHEQLFVNPAERIQFLKNNTGEDRESAFYESQALRSTGERIWVRENFRPVFDGMKNVLYYEGSIEDITERKEAEVALKEAKIQSDMASRAKSEFLANISHELRTPLNSIIGFSEIIRNQVFGPIEPPSYTEYAANIYDSGKNLLSIINQILDISRIDAGERELNESLVDVRKIASTCLDLMRPKINHAGLTIVDTVPENLPKLVAEEVALKQMLLNLLTNAVKFTAHGGRITLSAEIESSGKLRISVTDTGVGLSEDQIEKASSPFGLVDGRLDKGTGGAGLGLSLVHSLLRLHGGKLDLISQKGIGTTASLIFPAERIQSA